MDLFAGLDGLGSAPPKKVSLAQQRKMQEMNNRRTVQAFDGLDLLGSSSSHASSSTSSFNKQHTPPSNKPSNNEDDDLFGIFNSAPAPHPTQENKVKTNATGQSKLETRAPEPQSWTEKKLASKTQVRATNSGSASFSDHEPTPPWQTPKSSQGSDRGVAQLVDMGFEAEDAHRALEAMNGSVRGAVNWLMAEAQGLPLPEPKNKSISSSIASSDFSELQATASQIGASVFSKASSLFSKGRKEFEKAYSQYNNNYSRDSSGQPAWMRDKAKYDSRKSVSPDPELPRRPSSRKQQPTSYPEKSREQIKGPYNEQKTKEQLQEPLTMQTGQKISRAELFRQRQRERNAIPASKSASPTPIASADALSNGGSVSSKSSSKSTSVEPVPTKVLDIDLLNLTDGNESSSQANLSSTQSDFYTTSRELGSEAFRKGNYEDAIEHYTAALQVVPHNNPLRALLLSNRSAAYIKAGNLRGAFDDTTAGIALLPSYKGTELEKGTSKSDIWMKLVTRNAQAAENMEKFDAALKSWQLLLDNGFASPTVLEAKRRCLKALNPKTFADKKPDIKKSQRRGWGTTGALPTSAEGKAALEKVKANHDKLVDEERQKDLLRDKVSDRVESWRRGNETNLRVLLSTLQNVLWDTCDWTPVSLSDLVIPKKVRIVYMKAAARTHPDKVPATAPVEIRMISQSVFMAIQNAWDTFRQENNM